jgi:hypothetical protein
MALRGWVAKTSNFSGDARRGLGPSDRRLPDPCALCVPVADLPIDGPANWTGPLLPDDDLPPVTTLVTPDEITGYYADRE